LRRSHFTGKKEGNKLELSRRTGGGMRGFDDEKNIQMKVAAATKNWEGGKGQKSRRREGENLTKTLREKTKGKRKQQEYLKNELWRSDRNKSLRS